MLVNTNVQVDIKVSLITEAIKNAATLAIAPLTNQVLKDSNYYIPFDTGNLKKSGILSTKLNEGVITWQTPYAHAQYYGLPNKSKARNPNACQKWFEVAKSKNLKTWEKIANDEFGKYFK